MACLFANDWMTMTRTSVASRVFSAVGAVPTWMNAYFSENVLMATTMNDVVGVSRFFGRGSGADVDERVLF